MLKKLESIKACSELEEFFEYPVNSYSSGMVARLGFCVAMEVNPDVLMLDEVLGVGDFQFVKKSQSLMESRFASDKTIILTSHRS